MESQCIALALSTSQRCKLPALPGSPFCGIPSHRPGAPLAPGVQLHPEGHVTWGELGVPSSSPPDANLGDLEDLEAAPDPELEEAAKAGRMPEADPRVLEIDPALFGPPEEERGDPLPGGGGGGSVGGGGLSLVDLHPGPWTPRQVQRILLMATTGLLERAGKDRLSDAELEYGSDAWAAWLNQVAGSMDPDKPAHAVMLWSLLVLGSRFLPEAMSWAGARVLGRPGRASPARGEEEAPRGGASRNGSEPAPAPSEDAWVEFPS